MENNMQKVLFAAVAITMIATAFISGIVYQKGEPVPVVLTSYSGTDIVEEETYQVTDMRIQMGTDNDFVRDNHVTSYGIKIR